MAENPSFPYFGHHLYVDLTLSLIHDIIISTFWLLFRALGFLYILVQKGKTNHIMSGAKNGRISWRNISSLTDVLTLPIIITGELKPKYYICKKFLIFIYFWPSSKWLKNDPYHVLTFLDTKGKNLITTYCIVFILSCKYNYSPIHIKQLFQIPFFSSLILRELTNYNTISYKYISSYWL